MVSLAPMSEGHGAAMFPVRCRDGFALTDIEIQVNPDGFKVYHNRGVNLRDRATWFGPEAIAMAAAVCNGQITPDILADWCEENPAGSACDCGFKPHELLRMADQR